MIPYRKITRVKQRLVEALSFKKSRDMAKNLRAIGAVCNVCNGSHFINKNGRIMAGCKTCGSMERTRILKLMLDKHVTLRPGMKVLHVAPEKGLSDYLRSVVGDSNYTGADFDPARYATIPNMRKIDLCDSLDHFAIDGGYDLIIHSHVFEHLPCNWASALKNLNTLLNDNGTHFCCVPLMEGYYEESLAPMSARVATKRFGQYDHVRRFGLKDLNKTIGMVITVDNDNDLSRTYGVETLNKYNIPSYTWAGPNAHVPFFWKKQEMLI